MQKERERERVIKEGWKKYLTAESEGKTEKGGREGGVGVKNKDSMRWKKVWRRKRWCKIFRRIIVLSWQWRCWE